MSTRRGRGGAAGSARGITSEPDGWSSATASPRPLREVEVLPAPFLEDDERVEAVGGVAAAVQVGADEGLDGGVIEHTALPGALAEEQVACVAAPVVAEPVLEGDAEAGLPPLQELRRDEGPGRLLEDPLPQPPLGWEGRGHLQ